jgi:hypothetical protein
LPDGGASVSLATERLKSGRGDAGQLQQAYLSGVGRWVRALPYVGVALVVVGLFLIVVPSGPAHTECGPLFSGPTISSDGGQLWNAAQVCAHARHHRTMEVLWLLLVGTGCLVAARMIRGREEQAPLPQST